MGARWYHPTSLAARRDRDKSIQIKDLRKALGVGRSPGAHQQRMRLNQIKHFFEHYKDLEKGKWVKVEGWEGPDAARAEILAGVEAFKNAK